MSIRQGNKIIAGNVDNTDYTALLNKPQINSIELSGNKTLEELGIQASGDYATNEYVNTELDKKLNTNQITNCITKIPQDIKIELSEEGVLILKSGSKVYVPNGFEEDTTTQKFDIINIQEDISMTAIGDIENSAVYLNIESNSLVYRSFDGLSSGTTDPQTPSTCYYNTETNKILDTSSAGVQSQVSLPIAQVVASGGTFTEIKQVFNGFGYIGSTVFALPDIEGLIPNGRNADGSLNNIKFKITEVKTATAASNSYPITLTIYTNGNINTPNAVNTINDKENNYFYTGSTKEQSMSFGSAYVDSVRITEFNPKNTFQTVDKNNTEWASTAGKPSNKVINISIEATGSKFTAPANGTVTFSGTVSEGNNGRVYLASTGTTITTHHPNKGNYISCYIPVKAGNDVYYQYINVTSMNLRFFFDEGVK